MWVGLCAQIYYFTKFHDSQQYLVDLRREDPRTVGILMNPNMTPTLPETNSSPLKIGHPKRKRSYSNHPFSEAKGVTPKILADSLVITMWYPLPHQRSDENPCDIPHHTGWLMGILIMAS